MASSAASFEVLNHSPACLLHATRDDKLRSTDEIGTPLPCPEIATMVAAPQPVRALDPICILGAFSFLWMGFYVGLLFGVGSMVALMAAGTFFRGKFRLLVGFGGGFFGLAAWFNILLNYKEQYEQVVAFFTRFMTENWAHFVCDGVLCSVGAVLFVATLGGTKKGTKKVASMILSPLRRSKKAEQSEETPEIAEKS